MQAQADQEIEATTRAAENEAAQLIAEAEEQARAIRARHCARVEPVLRTEAAGLQNKAKLDALRAVANAREQLLSQAFSQAADCVAEMRKSKQYAAIFRVLAQEVVRELGKEVVVQVDPADIELARAAFAQLGVKADVQKKATLLGGLEATTPDGRVAVINTLASRLERARTILRGPVAEILVPKSEAGQ
jgi:vacuolar-type H+-ATPase subunit E/Vma4